MRIRSSLQCAKHNAQIMGIALSNSHLSHIKIVDQLKFLAGSHMHAFVVGLNWCRFADAVQERCAAGSRRLGASTPWPWDTVHNLCVSCAPYTSQ